MTQSLPAAAAIINCVITTITSTLIQLYINKTDYKKRKRLLSVGPGADPGVQAVNLQVTF